MHTCVCSVLVLKRGIVHQSLGTFNAVLHPEYNIEVRTGVIYIYMYMYTNNSIYL